jgi:hypothetical protein
MKNKKEKIYKEGEYSPGKECAICKSRGINEKRIAIYNKKYDAFLCLEHDYHMEEILKGKY